MAAMNLGYCILNWLEKPIEPMRLQLFKEAHFFAQNMDPWGRIPVILEALMTFARYLNQRSKAGPDAWMYVKHCLIDNLVFVFKYLDGNKLSVYVDFFCQVMWKCDHEGVLRVFCSLINDFDFRVSRKWGSGVSERWRVLGKSFDIDKLSHFETDLLPIFLSAVKSR
jgi:hypothetical protein